MSVCEKVVLIVFGIIIINLTDIMNKKGFIFFPIFIRLDKKGVVDVAVLFNQFTEKFDFLYWAIVTNMVK